MLFRTVAVRAVDLYQNKKVLVTWMWQFRLDPTHHKLGRHASLGQLVDTRRDVFRSVVGSLGGSTQDDVGERVALWSDICQSISLLGMLTGATSSHLGLDDCRETLLGHRQESVTGSSGPHGINGNVDRPILR